MPTLAELDAVAEIGKVPTSPLDLPEVRQRILERVRAILRPRRWSLLLVDATGRLRFEVVVGDGAEALRIAALIPPARAGSIEGRPVRPIRETPTAPRPRGPAAR